MDDDQKPPVREEDLRAIQTMRTFRRAVSIGVALFVLVAAIVMAIRSVQ